MSIKVYFLILLFIFFGSIKGFSQSKKHVDSIKNVVREIVRESIYTEKVKDSTAVYGATIILDITLKKKEQLVNITSNNHELSPGFNFVELNKLKKVDYSLLMGNKKVAKFSFKVCFIVYDSKYNPQMVKLDEVYESIKHLYLMDEFDVPNLGLILIRFDKKVYN